MTILALVVPAILLLAPGDDALAQELFVDPPFSQPSEWEFTVDIAIDCAGLDVKGVEAALTFDPFLLRLDSITPGPWYTGTGRNFFFFDYTPIDPQGNIHFSSSVLDGSNNQSLTIAVCHFTVLDFGSTPVDFQDVDVRSPVNLDLEFGYSTGDLILIDPAIPVSRTSFGGLKALFR
jgi:hypothetical protein